MSKTLFKPITLIGLIAVVVILIFLAFFIMKDSPVLNNRSHSENLDPVYKTSKVYNEEKEEAVIKDEEEKEIAKIRLLTPKNNYVMPGKDRKVAEFKIDNIESLKAYSEVFNKMDFYDIKDSYKKFDRPFTYKYRTIERVKQIPIYDTICEQVTEANGSKTNNCYEEIKGYNSVNIYNWIPLEKAENLEKGNITIGIFTEVKNTDYVEWIPTLYGVRIEEWATWTPSYNVGLVAYWNFDTGSGTNLVDVFTGVHNGTFVDSPLWVDGKLGNALYFDGSDDIVAIPSDIDLRPLVNLTTSLWVRPNTSTNGDLWQQERISNSRSWGIQRRSGKQLRGEAFTSGDRQVTGSLIAEVGGWSMFTLKINDSHLNIYVNGTLDGTPLAITPPLSYGDNLSIAFGMNFQGQNLKYNGSIDETGFWNRSLSDSEILDLWNGGTGLTFVPTPAPSNINPNVTINTPTNDSFATTTITFNVTATADTSIDNCSYSLNNGLDNFTLSNATGSPLNWKATNSSMKQGGIKANFFCVDIDNDFNNTESVDFVIDTIPPEFINITFPNNISYTELITRINITYIEAAPDSCWYSNNSGGINSTGQDCDINFTSLTYGQGSFTINAYINDTVGNENFTSPVTFFVDSIAPGINITTPINNTNTTDNTIDVNYTFTETNPSACWWTEDLGVTNISLTCGINITTPIWADGDHNVTISINDTLNTVNSSSVTFTIDTKITNNTLLKLGIIEYHIKDTNLTINWTVEDPFLDTCILEYSGINKTIPCLNNFTRINITSTENKTVLLRVNDTLGNINVSNMSWDYFIFENRQIFNNETIEGSTEPFKINITKLGSITITAINLNYNGTLNLATFSGTNEIIATIDKIIPNVDNITSVNFSWQFLLSNASVINSFNNSQLIKNISIDDCSVFSTLIYNYTLLDEEEQTLLSGDDLAVELDLTVLTFDRSLTVLNHSIAVNTTNPVQICTSLPLNSTKYQADTIVKYTNLGYAIEYYNIINFTLTNTSIPQNINLFILAANDSTEFQLTFTGADFLPVENALVFVNRQYIAESTFKTVELPKTDSNGQTVLHLVRNDIIYNIIVMKDGIVLGTFENLIAFCEDFTIGDCTINLNALSEVENIYSVDEDLGIVFTTPEYNVTTRIISFSYVSDDGTAKTVLMDVTRNDVFGNRSVCNDTLISAAGSLSCAVSPNIDDSILRTKIFVNGNEITTTQTKIDKSNMGVAGYFVFFVMAITMILMFSESKTAVLFGIGLSFLTAIGLGLITGSLIGLGAAGIWLILILILAIWKLNKERVQ